MKNSRKDSKDDINILKHSIVRLVQMNENITSSVNPTRCMISFWLLNICRQCLKSDRLGNTFPPHASFKILEEIQRLQTIN